MMELPSFFFYNHCLFHLMQMNSFKRRIESPVVPLRHESWKQDDALVTKYLRFFGVRRMNPKACRTPMPKTVGGVILLWVLLQTVVYQPKNESFVS